MNILMRFKAPLQSWGDDSNSNTAGSKRGTSPTPTLSGVIGIIGACMGIDGKHEPDKYTELCKAVKLTHTLCKSNCRVLTDYQTMGGGYNANDKYENRMIPKTSDGETPVSVGWKMSKPSRSKLSYRDYLQDGDFCAIVSVDDSLSDVIVNALKNPTWIPTLGRANCIPSERILVNYGKTSDEYIKMSKSILKCNTLIAYVSDKPSERYTSMTVYDVPHETKAFTYNSRIIYRTII